jgi:hypothetical protein
MSRNYRAQKVAAGFLGKMIVGEVSVMRLRGVAVVPRCLVRYGSTGRNRRVLRWGDRTVWCLLRVETDGGMGALVGGESKFGSTEDEGIGGDDGSDMTKVQLHSHV